MKENITYDLILKNGEAVLPNGSKEKLDIGIKNGLISKLGDLSNSSYKKMINISKLIVLPGAIDTQVHFREPGLIQKEDIYHGTKGAVLGGITSIFEMPNTDPPTINKKELNVKIKIAEKKAFCNFSFFAGAAKKNIKDLANLEKISGCCGVKIFMGSSTGDLLVEDDESLRNILLSVNRRVAVHSEDEYRLRERKSILERDNVTVFDHPIWRDVTTACNSTKRLLKIAKDVKKHVHVLHISTADEIELIRKFTGSQNESTYNFLVNKNNSRLLELKTWNGYQQLNEFIRNHTPFSGIDSLFNSANKLLKNSKTDLESSKALISHGDLCFSNIIKDDDRLRLIFIDPRGGKNLNYYRSPYYDLAKLCHSLLGGYDHIVNDIAEIKFNDDMIANIHFGQDMDRHNALFKTFVESLRLNYFLVRKIEISLFFPLR
mgnify:CR=1 FL=1